MNLTFFCFFLREYALPDVMENEITDVCTSSINFKNYTKCIMFYHINNCGNFNDERVNFGKCIKSVTVLIWMKKFCSKI